ncbi:hypothetical protein KSP39_PZI010999 [Platanthera zijinensis]|uniref:Helicase ATP-binding domain-containing protein n=1 Tax=Platanthera zijinensis TaxID=2320716 RepID=A0AAP0G5T6_9ASPA
MGKGDSLRRKTGSDGLERKLRKLAGAEEPALEPESFARCYQLEALEMAKKRNTIVFLDTGAGKTLIAVMLLRSYAYFIRKPSECIAVFLVPTVVLVQQQADVLEMHTDLKVGKFWGEMGVDFWSAEIWKQKLNEFEVFVMTPQILLNNLRHTFVKLDQIKLLIFDECHHAKGKDPYACIMSEFYHPQNLNPINIPRIFGMTASLTNTKGSSSSVVGKQISDLENLMNSKVYTVTHESVLAEYISFPNPKIKLYDHLNLPDRLSQLLVHLEILKVKHEKALRDMDFDTETVAGLMKKISKLCATFSFCLKELGLWLTIKACDSLSTEGHATIFWGQSNDRVGEQIVRKFSRDSSCLFSESITAGWSIGDDLKADVEAGYLTTKVSCLVLSLLEYSIRGIRSGLFFSNRLLRLLTGRLVLRSSRRVLRPAPFLTASGWLVFLVTAASRAVTVRPSLPCFLCPRGFIPANRFPLLGAVSLSIRRDLPFSLSTLLAATSLSRYSLRSPCLPAEFWPSRCSAPCSPRLVFSRRFLSLVAASSLLAAICSLSRCGFPHPGELRI